MQSLNSTHLEYLREALELLENGLKQNALSLKPITPIKTPELSALGAGQVAESTIPQPIGNLHSPVAVNSEEALTSKPQHTDATLEQYSQSCNNYFPKISWAKADATTSFLSSNNFFKQLPWAMKGLDVLPLQPIASIAKSDTESLSFEAARSKQDSLNYFQSLPWISSANTATVNEFLPPGSPTIRQSGSYFKEIESKKPSAPLQQADSAKAEQLFVGDIQDQRLLLSGDYFQGIQWQGALPEAIKAHPKLVKPDPDRSWMAELAMQSALKTAARGVEKNQDHQNCQDYFQRIFSTEKTQSSTTKLPIRDGTVIGGSLQNVVPHADISQVLASQNQHYFQKLPWNQL